MTTLLAFLATLAILIFVHEYGHYRVARLAGVRVLRFSVGFGPVLATRQDRHGTEWSLSALPLGGYVKMLDEREGEVAPDQLAYAFNRQSLGKRAAIVAAGPLANFLLAILLLWGLNLTGIPVLKPVLGEPAPASPAALAGIRAGETVVAINGEKPESWQDMHLLLLKHAFRDERLRLETQDPSGHFAYRNVIAPPRDEAFEQSPMSVLGLTRYLPPVEAVIGQLSPDGEGQRAGLRPGDRIRAVEGAPTAHWDEVVKKIRASADKRLVLRIERQGREMDLALTPRPITEGGQVIGRIGAAPRIDPSVMETLRGVARYGVWDSLTRALARTWELSAFSLEMMGRMVIGQVSLKNLSGPITIADYAGQSAQSGAVAFFSFLALLSISLAVLNLLPVPLLDGGHLLYYFAEFLTGRPVSDRTQEIGQKIGISLLATLMFFALYNDLQRLLAG
ncbi:MAG: RIP metalloprotease RseP [Betaproteobacteria bacterium]|nr:RIP metalloprotease RseP [Betaproteobacteria bacterium]